TLDGFHPGLGRMRLKSGIGNCFIVSYSGQQAKITRTFVQNQFIPKNAIQVMLNKGPVLVEIQHNLMTDFLKG
ncbi:MAG: hypothetical protein ACYS9Y_03060, partial [Planctomycetota bacterium]